MGKTKAVKKPSTPLKISTTSLFRRKSKNSTGQVDKESAFSSTPSGKSRKVSGKVVKGKGGGGGSTKGKVDSKEGSKQPSSGTSNVSSSSTSSSIGSGTPGGNKKQPLKKKLAAISNTATSSKKGSEGKAPPVKKKGVAVAPSKKGAQTPVKRKQSKSETTSKSKIAAQIKEKLSSGGKTRKKGKSPSSRSRGTTSRISTSSSSSSGSSSESSSEGDVAEKITTRKRSKSDAEQPLSTIQQKMAKNSEGESSKKNNTKSVGKKTNSKASATTTSVAKKVAKKAVSIVVSKKKPLPVKLEKSKTTTKATKTKIPQQEKSKSNKKMNIKKGGTTSSNVNVKGTKSKVKPRPKIKLKRMASLNAKAILEASFSFEPQEKKQRSPAPSSSVLSKVKNIDDISLQVVEKDYGAGVRHSSNGKPIIGSSTSAPKGNDDMMSVSTSTSPPPPPMQRKISGERKRKSSEVSSRRESSTSNKSTSSSKGQSKGDFSNTHSLNSSGIKIKGVSRRNSELSSAANISEDGNKLNKKNRKESPSPKKKTKVPATTTTSTSTSPLPSSEFYSLDQSEKKTKHKPKKEKSRSHDSGTNTFTGSRNQESLADHDSHQSQTNFKPKSGGYQAKEKKSSTPVAHFGTIYQPAGPMIEPHKITECVSGGILPETVKFPPDLKVTYQTHPPTSNSSDSLSSTAKVSSKKHSSSTTTHHHQKSDKSGRILHQPYKSSAASSSSVGTGTGTQQSSHPRTVQPNYPGTSYVSGATGPPASTSSAMLSQQQSTAAAQHHQQLTSTGMIGLSGHHHSLGSTGVSHQPPSASAGAPSSSGLYYSSTAGFAPHHSPFAPCKYPMVPPDSYRTHSPYPNSFLYPSATPQPSQQSYFMTPFYTPPLTPNSTPTVVSGGLGGNIGVGTNQPRPLSLATHHHPSVAAASLYHPQSGPSLQSALHHPSNYLVASPHHSIQPSPTAPGHAGHFHPNQSTLPACPCPTESYQLSSTSNNKQQQQQQSVSSVSLPALEVGVKYPKSQSQQALVSVTATRPSRHSNKDVPQHPPTCITPAVAADPPITIQLLNSNIDVKQTQDRQLESAKTFTEQYSLPDDITITPIIVSNPNTNALLLMNSSISIVTNFVPSSSSETNSYPGVNTLSSKEVHKCTTKKEKDIVHLIDPRSGHRTTIAKHISNKNLLANKNPFRSTKSPPKDKYANQSVGSAVSRLKSNINNKIGSIKVGKFNPDLDVIVINRNNGSSSGDASDHIAENSQHQNLNQNNRVNNGMTSELSMSMGLQSKLSSKKTRVNSNSPQQVPYSNLQPSKGNKGQIVPKRVALAHNDNNSPRKIAPKSTSLMGKSLEKAVLQSTNPSFTYSLPPGISVISSGVGSNLSITPSTTLQNHSANFSVRPMSVQNYQNKSDLVHPNDLTNQNSPKGKNNSSNNNKKRISLNECIDGLQMKKMKLLADHNFVSGINHDLNNGRNVNTTTVPKTNGRNNSAVVFPFNKSNLSRSWGKDAGATSARVRDPEFNIRSTVINSSDAIVAVSAVVVDPETYHMTRNARVAAAMTAAVKGQSRNGLKKTNKFHQQQQNRKNLMHSSLNGKKFSTDMKMKTLEKVGLSSSNTRSTRSSAANAKIRTRLSTKPKLGGELNQLNSRSRSRLLRKRNQIIGGPSNMRKSESDCSSSTNTSRSNSAVRIVGNLSGGKVERERGNKYPTQAFINAVADLYQYRRNVMLRVPKAGVGIFPSANNVKLLNIPENASSSSLSPVQFYDKSKIQNQLSPSSQNFLQPHEYKSTYGSNSPRSSSPNLPSPGPGIVKSPVGSMVANAAKKRAIVKPLSPAVVNGALLQLARRQPKWSNGWRFEGEPYESKVLVNNDDQPVLRLCYPAMRHENGDVIQTRDCVLLKSGSRKNDLPYIAKIAALWENPLDGEMMFSLLWYYRPEHTEMSRTKDDMMDEIFASKHIDVNSVATIDDRCYVLTFNEYCRYKKRLKQLEEGLPNKPLISLTGSSMINNNAAGNIAAAVWSGRVASEDPNRIPSPGKISPEVVFFCRKVYDFRQKRIMKNPS